MKKILFSLAAILALNSLQAVEILRPVKITGSSFFSPNNKREFHGPETTGDGKTGDTNRYWASDFKNKAKAPHWVIFDFGKPVTFDAVKLDMVERYNFPFSAELSPSITSTARRGKIW